MSRYNWRRWSTRQWLAFLFIVLIGLPTVAFLLVSTALLAYIHWPRTYSYMAMPSVNPGTEHLVLIAHGVRDTTASWSDPLKRLMETDNKRESVPTQVMALDWNPYSQETFRCSVDGMRIGQLLGQAWSTSSELKSVHLIGHSCGAFVVLGLCKALRSERPDIRLQSTYLDPVSIYGGWSWNYGIKHFGRCADFSEAYIDREDGVPGSNQLIPNTHTFDVTHARHGADYMASPHVWPTYYYQQLVRAGKHPKLGNKNSLWQLYPRGEIEEITQLPPSTN